LPVDPLVDKPLKPCKCGSNEFIPEKDVLDTWATSSLTPDIAIELFKDKKIFKKLKRIARKSALTYKAKEKSIIILEDFTFDAPKTKSFVELLNNFELHDKKVLLVLGGLDKNVYLSSRNLPKTKVIKASDINTYDILNANSLIIAESSLAEIERIHTAN